MKIDKILGDELNIYLLRVSCMALINPEVAIEYTHILQEIKLGF